ncbi:rho GTPase-activating protein 30 [Gastrophryne carolinensis]
MSIALKARQKVKKRTVKDKVFGCDLMEHLMMSGQEVPQVLKSCSEFVEEHGVVDGIYRLCGISSNVQKLRQEFDIERPPDLNKSTYLQDVHCVSSLCKAYFRELPNPLLTYQLYDKFAEAVAIQLEEQRLIKIRDVLKELPIQHYRTLEYLMKHLLHMASFSAQTNMHTRNLAIVWAPNLLRSKDIESSGFNGTSAFMEVRVQSIVVEFILTHVDALFGDGSSDGNVSNASTMMNWPTCVPEDYYRSLSYNLPSMLNHGDGPPQIRPYHTIIDLNEHKRKGSLKAKKWKSIFNLGRSNNDPKRKSTRQEEKEEKSENMHLRPAKSMDSLSSASSNDFEHRALSRGSFRLPFRRQSIDEESDESRQKDDAFPDVGQHAHAAPADGRDVKDDGQPKSEPTTPKPGRSSVVVNPQGRSPKSNRNRAEKCVGVHISGPFSVTLPFHITSNLSRLTRGMECPSLNYSVLHRSSERLFSPEGHVSMGNNDTDRVKLTMVSHVGKESSQQQESAIKEDPEQNPESERMSLEVQDSFSFLDNQDPNPEESKDGAAGCSPEGCRSTEEIPEYTAGCSPEGGRSTEGIPEYTAGCSPEGGRSTEGIPEYTAGCSPEGGGSTQGIPEYTADSDMMGYDLQHKQLEEFSVEPPPDDLCTTDDEPDHMYYTPSGCLDGDDSWRDLHDSLEDIYLSAYDDLSPLLDESHDRWLQLGGEHEGTGKPTEGEGNKLNTSFPDQLEECIQQEMADGPETRRSSQQAIVPDTTIGREVASSVEPENIDEEASGDNPAAGNVQSAGLQGQQEDLEAKGISKQGSDRSQHEDLEGKGMSNHCSDQSQQEYLEAKQDSDQGPQEDLEAKSTSKQGSNQGQQEDLEAKGTSKKGSDKGQQEDLEAEVMSKKGYDQGQHDQGQQEDLEAKSLSKQGSNQHQREDLEAEGMSKQDSDQGQREDLEAKGMFKQGSDQGQQEALEAKGASKPGSYQGQREDLEAKYTSKQGSDQDQQEDLEAKCMSKQGYDEGPSQKVDNGCHDHELHDGGIDDEDLIRCNGTICSSDFQELSVELWNSSEPDKELNSNVTVQSAVLITDHPKPSEDTLAFETRSFQGILEAAQDLNKTNLWISSGMGHQRCEDNTLQYQDSPLISKTESLKSDHLSDHCVQIDEDHHQENEGGPSNGGSPVHPSEQRTSNQNPETIQYNNVDAARLSDHRDPVTHHGGPNPPNDHLSSSPVEEANSPSVTDAVTNPDGSVTVRLTYITNKIQQVKSVPIVPPKPQFAKLPPALKSKIHASSSLTANKGHKDDRSEPVQPCGDHAVKRCSSWRNATSVSFDSAMTLAKECRQPQSPVRRMQTYCAGDSYDIPDSKTEHAPNIPKFTIKPASSSRACRPLSCMSFADTDLRGGHSGREDATTGGQAYIHQEAEAYAKELPHKNRLSMPRIGRRASEDNDHNDLTSAAHHQRRSLL